MTPDELADVIDEATELEIESLLGITRAVLPDGRLQVTFTNGDTELWRPMTGKDHPDLAQAAGELLTHGGIYYEPEDDDDE